MQSQRVTSDREIGAKWDTVAWGDQKGSRRGERKNPNVLTGWESRKKGEKKSTSQGGFGSLRTK